MTRVLNVFSFFGDMAGMSAQFENRIPIPVTHHLLAEEEAQAMVLWDKDVRSDTIPWAGLGQLHYAVRVNRSSAESDWVRGYHYRVPPWSW
jgi:hypothetical protein